MLHTNMQEAGSTTEPEDQMLRCKEFMMPAFATPLRLFWSVASLRERLTTAESGASTGGLVILLLRRSRSAVGSGSAHRAQT